MQGACDTTARAEVSETGGTLFARRAVVIGRPGAAPARRPSLRLAGGTLVTPALLETGTGGDFDFTGGTLQADRVGFAIVDRGGTIAPGPGIARTALGSSLTIRSGGRAIEVDGASSDQVRVAGAARLGGALEIRPVAGFAPRRGNRWTVLVAAGRITGAFTRVSPGYAVSVVGHRVVVTFDGGPSFLSSVTSKR